MVILGVPIDDVTMDEAVDEIVRFVSVGRQSGRWHQVTTVNLDFVTNAVTDVRLLKLLQRAELNIADGMPIVWGAKALGSPVRGRVAGVDLVDSLARLAAAGHITMHLFGAAPGVAEEAASRLRARHPGATVTHGTSGPQFSNVADMDPAVLLEIRNARPDVLCVALGNPKQEWWIEHYGPELQVPVLIGVGGTLDFIVGQRRRAPRGCSDSASNGSPVRSRNRRGSVRATSGMRSCASPGSPLSGGVSALVPRPRAGGRRSSSARHLAR